MVCKRWRDVSFWPDLLRKVALIVKLHDDDEGAAALRTARSLLSWLHLHGRSVRQLEVRLECRDEELDVWDFLSDSELAEFMSLVDCCINVCAASLERLELDFPE